MLKMRNINKNNIIKIGSCTNCTTGYVGLGVGNGCT